MAKVTLRLYKVPPEFSKQARDVKNICQHLYRKVANGEANGTRKSAALALTGLTARTKTTQRRFVYIAQKAQTSPSLKSCRGQLRVAVSKNRKRPAVAS